MAERSSKSEGFVSFTCPSCLKLEIRRSLNERATGARYICKNCEFTGPN
ncbi:RNA-binding protein [Candidatus Woesearchaeota archaeon]|nr:RNA-binding protein [Candidatus Woesearchaeota archaeon]